MLPAMGNTPDTDDLRLFHTGEHPCGYWPDRYARDLVLDPRDPRLAEWYPMALGWGFRRSGDIVYRPHCRRCRACTAVRIPVDRFAPDLTVQRVRGAGHWILHEKPVEVADGIRRFVAPR